jgi:hypothetical protein
MDELNEQRQLTKSQQEWQEEWLAQCRGRQFVRKTFASYSSLRSIEADEEGWYYPTPYLGQEYDSEKFWVCEDAWDHEHCHVCNVHIEPGDEYWQSAEQYPLELCLACYERLTARQAEQDIQTPRSQD